MKSISRQRAWQLAHPHATKAHDALNYAVSKRLLIRPNGCDQCGTPCVPHGHHPDYSKPLSVVWLCNSCHGQVHSRGQMVAHAIRFDPALFEELRRLASEERRKFGDMVRVLVDEARDARRKSTAGEGAAA